MTTVQLGHKYRDTITGLTGTAMSRSTFLYGCVRVGIEAVIEGKPEEFWFDEQRLEEAETRQPVTTDARSGGPRRTPPARRTA